MGENEKDKDYEEIDLLEIWQILLANVRNIAVVTIGFLVLGGLYILIASPTYESVAMLRIKQPQGFGSSLLDVAGGSVTLQRMSTYADILESRSVVIPVIEAIEEQDEEGLYPEYERYKKAHITTEAVRDTEILSVSFKADDPEKAYRGNQLIVDGFISRMTELSRTAQTATKNFLAERAEEAKKELERTEATLEAYKTENRILNPSTDAQILVERAADLRKRMEENQIVLQAAQARLSAVEGQLSGSGRASADNRMIQQYNHDLAELEAKRIRYLDKYTDKHPLMVEVNDQIAALRTKIADEINRVASLEAPSDNSVHQSLVESKYKSEGEIAVALERAPVYAELLEKAEAAMDQLPAAEHGYVRVARDANVANEIYVMLAKRLEESKVAEVMTPNDVQIIDASTMPDKPVAPRKFRVMAIAGLLGILLGSAIAVARAMLTRSIVTEEDVKKYLNLPVLGVIPDEESVTRGMERLNNGDGILNRIGGWLWKNR